MTYILSKDLPPRNSHLHDKRREQGWQDYQRRLNKIRKHLPPPVAEYAFADWHYNPSDHRCPHDAWLEYVTIREPASGERSEIRGLEIEMRLLGAYHDGHLDFTYRRVQSYAFDLPYREGSWEWERLGHGDWMVDEVDLAGHGNVTHEIEWLDGGHWIIQCQSFEVVWRPFESAENGGSEEVG
jgi:hypothetical protein